MEERERSRGQKEGRWARRKQTLVSRPGQHARSTSPSFDAEGSNPCGCDQFCEIEKEIINWLCLKVILRGRRKELMDPEGSQKSLIDNKGEATTTMAALDLVTT